MLISRVTALHVKVVHDGVGWYMEIPGINSILNQEAGAVWAGEPTPSADCIALFKKALFAINRNHFEEAARLLKQIERCEPTLSQAMRLQYLYGLLLSEQHSYNQAHVFYTNALNMATAFGDIDSQILLTMMAGEVRYGAMRNLEAQAHFQIALELWRLHSESLPHPPVEPEATILEFSGRVLWLTGQFEEAQAAVARVLAAPIYRGGVPRSAYLRSIIAGALWTLALAMRAQSDQMDGDAHYLGTALRRARKALGIYEGFGTSSVNMARFCVQIAEIYLDLAEVHLMQDNKAAARPMQKEGFNYARQAQDFLKLTGDVWAELLTELTLLRHDIMGQSQRDAIYTLHDIEARFLAIEYKAADLDDHIISAKDATLRAEWLMQFGDQDAARSALQLALKGFSGSGMGQATRAQRLLRRIGPASDPGGQWRPSGGPIIGPLEVPDPDRDDSN
jgi:tetratricopeptide (TPR) repeat protein